MGAAATAARTGETLEGRFRLGRHVADDRVAEHYEAVDLSTGDQVRVRLMRPELALHRGAHETFVGLSQHLSRRPVPHLARVMCVGTDITGVPFVVEEGGAGRTLHAQLRALPSGFSLPDGAAVVSQVLDGLAHLHLAGVCHGHVDPSHIVVAMQGDRPLTWLCQSVGLAEPSEHSAYRAPEGSGQGATDEGFRDVFAIAVLMHHVWTGQVPRPSAPLSELRERLPQLPSAVLGAMAEVLNAKTAERIPDAASLWMRLEAPLGQLARGFKPPNAALDGAVDGAKLEQHASERKTSSMRSPSGLRARPGKTDVHAATVMAESSVSVAQRRTIPVPGQSFEEGSASARDDARVPSLPPLPSDLPPLPEDRSLNEPDGGYAFDEAAFDDEQGAGIDQAQQSLPPVLPAIGQIGPSEEAHQEHGSIAGSAASAPPPPSDSFLRESGEPASAANSLPAPERPEEVTTDSAEPSIRPASPDTQDALAAAFSALAPEKGAPAAGSGSDHSPARKRVPMRNRRRGAAPVDTEGDAMAAALLKGQAPADFNGSPRSRKRERLESAKKADALTDAQMARLMALREKEKERRWLRYLELLLLLLFLPALYKAVTWLSEPGALHAREVLGEKFKVSAVVFAAAAVGIHVKLLVYNAKAKLLMLKPVIYASTVVTLSVTALVVSEALLPGAAEAAARGAAGGAGGMGGGIIGRAARMVLPAAAAGYLFLGAFFGLYMGMTTLARSMPLAFATWLLAAMGGATAYGVANATFMGAGGLAGLAHKKKVAGQIVQGLAGDHTTEVERVEAKQVVIKERSRIGDGLDAEESVEGLQKQREEDAKAYRALERNIGSVAP